jgi:hypothetical protein
VPNLKRWDITDSTKARLLFKGELEKERNARWHHASIDELILLKNRISISVQTNK